MKTKEPSKREVARQTGLRAVGGRPKISNYVSDLWGRRHFIYADSRARSFSGNRDLLLGNVWLVGVPILQGLVYYIIFGLVLKTDRGIENFTGYLMIGIFLFRYSAGCLNSGVTSMTQSRGLIKSFQFPRAAIPISVVVRETLSMGPVLVTLALLLLIVPPGTTITATWLLFPLVFLLQMLLNAGLALYTARLGSAIPDLRHVVSFVSRFWFYTSGVFFSIDRFVQEGFWLAVMKANPMYLTLDISRDLLIYDTLPDARTWMMLSVWSFVTAIFGFWYFWQGEETYGQH